MAQALTSHLLDLMSDTVGAQPGSTDAFGEWTASGDQIYLPAHISGKSRLVRDASGREAVSSLRATVVVTEDMVDDWIANGWDGWIDEGWVQGTGVPAFLTTYGYRFFLPTRFVPNGREGDADGLTALSIGRASDENGYHHDWVDFA